MAAPTQLQLQRAFQRAVLKARYAGRIPGLMGKPDGGGGFDFTAPGGRGYTWVRYTLGQSATTTIAVNKRGVAETGDTPIWLDYDIDGRLIIVDTRYEGG